MGSAHYLTVYDAAALFFPDWWFTAFGLGMLGIAWLTYRFAGTEQTRAKAFFGVVFMSIWCVVACLGTFTSHQRLRSALELGNFVTVEGEVVHFKAGGSNGAQPETWDVVSGGVTHHYRYAEGGLTPGFRQLQRHGGPVRERLRVRIADVGGVIARLEIDPRTPSVAIEQ